jgi:hypothetical protein
METSRSPNRSTEAGNTVSAYTTLATHGFLEAMAIGASERGRPFADRGIAERIVETRATLSIC